MNKMFNNPDQEMTMPIEKAYDGDQLNDAVETFQNDGLSIWACYSLFAAAIFVIAGILSIPFWI